MARVTEAELRAKANLPDGLAVQSFIDDAARLVARIEANNTCGLVEADFKTLECYLAAHLVSMTYRQAIEKEVGKSREVYRAGKEGLRATTFGEAALLFDCTGTLEELGKKRIVGAWLGKCPT